MNENDFYEIVWKNLYGRIIYLLANQHALFWRSKGEFDLTMIYNGLMKPTINKFRPKNAEKFMQIEILTYYNTFLRYT